MSERKAVFRGLWRNRASSAAAIFMVATSAAVATTTFALADAALWRQLPYRDASRLGEWAVRLALGASHRHLRRLVFGQSATYAAVGVVIGIALLFLARTTISGLVYGVSVWDPYIVIGCTAVIVVVCLLSATIPAFRASRISATEFARQHAVARRGAPRPFRPRADVPAVSADILHLPARVAATAAEHLMSAGSATSSRG